MSSIDGICRHSNVAHDHLPVIDASSSVVSESEALETGRLGGHIPGKSQTHETQTH